MSPMFNPVCISRGLATMRVKKFSMKTIFQTHMYIPASQINIHVMGHMFYIAVADPGVEGGGQSLFGSVCSCLTKHDGHQKHIWNNQEPLPFGQILASALHTI